ncbi:MAG: polysaccharide deacetylase family protein [Pyrinomonadaceae bacterium]
MKTKFLNAALTCLVVLSSTVCVDAQISSVGKDRAVAVTFDDLPVISLRHDLASQSTVTRKLLHAFKSNRVPAIGFVNENKLLTNGTLDERRVGFLRMWLDAGLELGNHTFSHPDLHSTPLDIFKEDVVRGEEVTRGLLQAKGRTLRYFRHPFLHTGKSLETKQQFEKFLSGRGYRIAPVTVDNSEWIFARAYDNAMQRGDKQLMKRIGQSYISYMEQKFAYFEQQSMALFGYEMKQILLLRANTLNGDYFHALAQMMKKRSYNFITLDEALTDQAYTSPDTYAGPEGITWIHRWAITVGKDDDFFRGEPSTPAFVLKEAGVRAE